MCRRWTAVACYLVLLSVFRGSGGARSRSGALSNWRMRRGANAAQLYQAVKQYITPDCIALAVTPRPHIFAPFCVRRRPPGLAARLPLPSAGPRIDGLHYGRRTVYRRPCRGATVVDAQD